MNCTGWTRSRARSALAPEILGVFLRIRIQMDGALSNLAF
jgi:hypothetical protein